MTGPAGRLKSNAAIGVLAAVISLAVAACAPTFYEIPIETPIQPKLDVSPFQRILVAGFVAGGTDEVDTNQETVRLLRSQLRTKSDLRVIDADALALADVAQDQNRDATQPARSSESGASPPPSSDSQPLALPTEIKDDKDLEAYERLFANTAYWRRIGEEYQNPLIVTGTVLFIPHARANFVTRESEEYDSFGRRQVVPVRTYMERKGFILRPKFIFIDGRTGATLHSESYREEILYSPQQNTPALSSYFELMDRLVPSFLSALSSQKIRGTRVLLR
jgi:hypothetical protein